MKFILLTFHVHDGGLFLPDCLIEGICAAANISTDPEASLS